MTDIIDPYIGLAILAVTLSSFVTRSGPLMLSTRLKLPAHVESALRYAPACALAAIIAPDLLFIDAQLALSISNPKLLAGGAAAAIFAVNRSMIAALSGGMAVFWLVRAFVAT